MAGRKSNGEGLVRKLPDGKYECMIQSQFLNPETGKPKRFMRKGNTEGVATRAYVFIHCVILMILLLILK